MEFDIDPVKTLKVFPSSYIELRFDNIFATGNNLLGNNQPGSDIKCYLSGTFAPFDFNRADALNTNDIVRPDLKCRITRSQYYETLNTDGKIPVIVRIENNLETYAATVTGLKIALDGLEFPTITKRTQLGITMNLYYYKTGDT